MIKYNKNVIDGIVFIASITFVTLLLTDIYNEKNKMIERPKRDASALRAKKTLEEDVKV